MRKEKQKKQGKDVIEVKKGYLKKGRKKKEKAISVWKNRLARMSAPNGEARA